MHKNTHIPGLPEGAADPCVHCGFCLPTCASYRVLANEMDSPRGRIHTLRAIEAGEIEMDAVVASHFDTCLGCYACVTACPSGVRYDQLIEATRPKLKNTGQRNQWQITFRKFLLQLLPYPSRVRLILNPLRAYTGTELQRIARIIGVNRLFGPEIEAMERLLPKITAEHLVDELPTINKATAPMRGRVSLLLGCVQRCFDPAVSVATVKVLQANGFEVIVPKNQGCCGAVSHHRGNGTNSRLANELINCMNSISGKIDAVVVSASGCGHTMKEYGKILMGRFNSSHQSRTYRSLAGHGLAEEFLKCLNPFPRIVAIHDACHMIHGQNISEDCGSF